MEEWDGTEEHSTGGASDGCVMEDRRCVSPHAAPSQHQAQVETKVHKPSFAISRMLALAFRKTEVRFSLDLQKPRPQSEQQSSAGEPHDPHWLGGSGRTLAFDVPVAALYDQL